MPEPIMDPSATNTNSHNPSFASFFCIFMRYSFKRPDLTAVVT
jgi:hypothetical protein